MTIDIHLEYGGRTLNLTTSSTDVATHSFLSGKGEHVIRECMKLVLMSLIRDAKEEECTGHQAR